MDGKMVQHSIPVEILDDLSSRFIINAPERDKNDIVRIFFLIELAHWYYIDFYCCGDGGEDTEHKTCSIKQFAAHMFNHIPFIKLHCKDLDDAFETWRAYKLSVPTYGAVILSENLSHVLLVQSYWKSKNNWSFPKGKVNEEEDPASCAIREVLEETGFDISQIIDPNDFIEGHVNGQLARLYYVANVPLATKFQPKTRNEIKAVSWFCLNDLPSCKKDVTSGNTKLKCTVNTFYMILPFMRRIKEWVEHKTKRGAQNNRRYRPKSLSELENLRSKGKNTSTQDDFLKKTPLQVTGSKKDKQKPTFKRQLFNSSNIHKFTAPSWQDFKFDKYAISEALDS